MKGGTRLALFAIVAAQGLFGQSLGVQRQPEPVASPAAEPLPRRFIGVHPVTIYSGLLSSSPEQRKLALQQLGNEYTVASETIEASIRAVNLDADVELEYVLIAKGFPPDVMAYVFDKDERGWWVIGEFTYRAPYDPNEEDRFFELREIVRYGRKDLMVRDTGHGTGIIEIHLSIYRMNNGSLYRIFQVSQDRKSSDPGNAVTEIEHRDISFPEQGRDGLVFLVSRYRKRVVYNPHTRPDRTTSSCTVFRWNSVAFVFVPDKAAGAMCSNQGASAK